MHFLFDFTDGWKVGMDVCIEKRRWMINAEFLKRISSTRVAYRLHENFTIYLYFLSHKIVKKEFFINFINFLLIKIQISNGFDPNLLFLQKIYSFCSIPRNVILNLVFNNLFIFSIFFQKTLKIKEIFQRDKKFYFTNLK